MTGVGRLVVSISSVTFLYTEDADLPYFNRAAVKATGIWYYTSALDAMGAKFCFHYHSVNIGPSYK